MNAEDVLKYGNLTVQKALKKVPAEAWNTPDVCGWWSCRQILAHLSSFEQALIEVMDLYLGKDFGPLLSQMGQEGGEKFNEKQVAAREAMTAEEILAEYDRAFLAVNERLVRIPVETRRQAGLIPWYGPEYDLEDLLAYMFYGHKREHIAQVNVFLDTL